MLPKLFGVKGKRGNAGIVMGGAGTVISLFFISVIVFALALTGSEIKDSTNDSVAENVIDETLTGVTSFANFSPVLWIITGVGLLVGILLAAFGFLFRARMG